ncbi:melatonin receptor type 1A [Nilaparvata lugens]|uniref:melatonin receptor type 1A n=1 Tax=Nilaparvata lugens TaxID=108931 RepID=UPI00193EA083|nr:melatonin receptor type 1A [Nilaparvata lugens]XP_039286313.1 melatonin receptor type 1A [Nilaparvata lugens]XP_039286314.1 melatonin receptor type 1A [Nilaparvata lugens]
MGFNSTDYNSGTETIISPVTLSSDWSRVARLLLVVGLAVIGSVGNVYMVSAVMIEDHLKKKGNILLVNTALADLLITGLVMPASATVILAGLHDSPPVCEFQWFLASLCWLVTVLTILATAVENYARLCLSADAYAPAFTSTRITTAVLLIWLLSGCAVTAQVAYRLGPDYCTRKFSGTFSYQVTVAILFVILPTILTSGFYLRTTLHVRQTKSDPSFKPPITFSWDYSLMKTNFYSFIVFLIFWLPFGVILGIGNIQKINPRTFYNLAWLALSKSCINNFLYCITNRHFRNAYINLFHYCCCKTTVAFSRRSRGEPSRPTGDVRVHIIPGYNMYSYTSPQRARETGKTSAGKRSAGTNRGAGRSNGRDVYQL